jgi:2,5-furandicarboxylate decarboxylase 1
LLSINDYLDLIRKSYPQEILIIDEEVNPADFEVTAILRHLELIGKYPVVCFTHPLNLYGEVSKFPLVINVFATRKRCALALGLNPEQSKLDFSLEYGRREAGQLPAEIVSKSQAPTKEIVKIGEEADLREFPIVRHHDMDSAPYIDMAVIMRDPESKAYNTAFQRTMYKGPRRLGLQMAPQHNWEIVRRHEAFGQNTPVVLIISHHPAFFLGTLNSAPFETNDYEIIGSVMEESLRLTPSETLGEDFLIPADADILVEGEVLSGVREAEGPFGECHGYSSPQGLGWVIEVKAVTCRRDAFFQDIFAGHTEHWILGAIPKEGAIYDRIKATLPNVKGVHLPNSGCGRYNCYISIKQTLPGQGRQAALVALATADFIKNVVIVDEDIDPFNEQEVTWAISTRVQADEDIEILKEVSYSGLDPSVKVRGITTKMVIDATKPVGKEFDKRLEIPGTAMARVESLLKMKSLI